MAMIKCKDCGKEYSDRADKCPGCGNIPNEYIQPKKSNDFNVGRFKIIVALYVACFIALCAILPMNVYFVGNEYLTKDRTSYSYGKVDEDEVMRAYSLAYYPIWKAGSEPHNRADLGEGYEGEYTGIYRGKIERTPNILIIIVEIVTLTVLFAGVAYISCVRKKP